MKSGSENNIDLYLSELVNKYRFFLERFSEKPLIVFWETTKACPLACIHCRAEAIKEPLPGELSTEEGYELIDEILRFGRPYPILVFTGGL